LNMTGIPFVRPGPRRAVLGVKVTPIAIGRKRNWRYWLTSAVDRHIGAAF
jgi:hypothetical protein